MKCFALLLLVVVAPAVEAAQLRTLQHAVQKAAQTPMQKVVGLLTELEVKIESDGKLEQKSYDKYACWCEDTLGRKASDIAQGKERIDTLTGDIKELKANVASLGAEIDQTKKDVASNIESQREATEVRDKAYEEYSGDKTESEQCIGALEAAIGVLTGAGSGRTKEVEMLSVVSGVRSVLKHRAAQSLGNKELEVVKRFVEHPEDFVAQSSNKGFMSATQVGNNPFGDYGPQSTQIQGILKGMYDSLTTDLEKDNAEESDAQKAFEELMTTKKQELETLQLTLERTELDKATKEKSLADKTAELDDTQEQLKADEKFFEETKSTCQTKAKDWAERTRLRTEELTGIAKAIQIMSSDEAKGIFTNATTAFVQLASRHTNFELESTGLRNKVYLHLRKLAGKTHSVSIAELAVMVKGQGHFDKVIASIDKMIALLREEEAADIAHRDRCQRAENKNDNDMEDLDHEIQKSSSTIQRLESKESELEGMIKSLAEQISNTTAEMEDLLEMRNQETGEFKTSLKDDVDAVALLDRAIVALSEFYRRNKIAMSLAQQKEDPEYSVDQDKAPELSYDPEYRADGGVGSGAAYGGRSSETGGIVAIIKMLKEDLEKEISQARVDDAEAQKQYNEQRAALQETLAAQKNTKLATEKELSGVQAKIADIEKHKTQKGDDKDAELELKSAIYSDCSWVATHFGDRRDKRKDEMDGLEQAKGFLAGMEETEV